MHIIHLDSMALDGDAFLLFKVHRVKNLIFHVSGSQSVGDLQHPVCERTFTMVDMCDYAKVSYVLHIIERSQKFNLISLTGKVTKKRAKTPKHGLNYPKTAIKYPKTLSFFKGLKYR